MNVSISHDDNSAPVTHFRNIFMSEYKLIYWSKLENLLNSVRNLKTEHYELTTEKKAISLWKKNNFEFRK